MADKSDTYCCIAKIGRGSHRVRRKSAGDCCRVESHDVADPARSVVELLSNLVFGQLNQAAI